MELFIYKIDAKLLKLVKYEILKSKNIKQTDSFSLLHEHVSFSLRSRFQIIRQDFYVHFVY